MRGRICVGVCVWAYMRRRMCIDIRVDIWQVDIGIGLYVLYVGTPEYPYMEVEMKFQLDQ